MHAEHFLARPNSPNKRSLHAAPLQLYYVDADPSLESKPDISFEDFEFEPHAQATASFCLQQQQQQQKLMSFADELFHGGQLLPLKLPPRLQAAGGSTNCSLPSSCATSPTKLSGSLLRSPFGRRGLKNKDIDPFMVALEKVRKEDAARRGRKSPERRARSLSPLRSSTWFREHGIGSLQTRNVQQLRKMDSLSDNGGTWKGWIKEVIKTMGRKPLANWQGPFLCFGHNI